MTILTSEKVFIEAVHRLNRLFIILGIFFLIYFLLNPKVDVFLFLLALLNMAFSLLSYKHLMITARLADELERARASLENISEEIRKMHSD